MSVIKSSTATVIESAEQPMSITKPEGSILDACVSTRNPNAGSVKVLLTGIPVHKIAEARDWVRLHPDEAKYWSKEYCFVNVPAPGARETMHFIAESLVAQY